MEGIDAASAIGQEGVPITLLDEPAEQREVSAETVYVCYRRRANMIPDAMLAGVFAQIVHPAVQLAEQGPVEAGPGCWLHVAPGNRVLAIVENLDLLIFLLRDTGADRSNDRHGNLQRALVVEEADLSVGAGRAEINVAFGRLRQREYRYARTYVVAYSRFIEYRSRCGMTICGVLRTRCLDNAYFRRGSGPGLLPSAQAVSGSPARFLVFQRGCDTGPSVSRASPAFYKVIEAHSPGASPSNLQCLSIGRAQMPAVCLAVSGNLVSQANRAGLRDWWTYVDEEQGVKVNEQLPILVAPRFTARGGVCRAK